MIVPPFKLSPRELRRLRQSQTQRTGKWSLGGALKTRKGEKPEPITLRLSPEKRGQI